MGNKPLVVPFSVLFLIIIAVSPLHVEGGGARDHGGGARGVRDPDQGGEGVGMVARREERMPIAATEYGEISAVQVSDGASGVYHLQFITLEPNALFLPVLLHSDMVLYVHTGSGRLNWVDENDAKRIDLRRGDIYALPAATIFHVQSSLEPEREKLRIHAIFANSEEDMFFEPSIGAYSSIGDLLRGFDSKVLQEAFKVPEEVVKEIISATRPPPIVHAGDATVSERRTKYWEWEARFLKTYLSSTGYLTQGPGSNKKRKTFNLFDADRDFENCNGWSLTVTRKDLHVLKHSNVGVFMVNLTKGSMMGPHWNPRATEIAIVLQGKGMIRVVCSSTAKESECKNTRFKVNEGDVFIVPRFHPMAQMSFNNESIVFMGFSTSTKTNYPQFLAGKSSILQALDRDILAAAFNVADATIGRILAWQTDSIILDCTSCAEEEERIMEEGIEKERRQEEEEAKRREEEEEEERARKREEEEEEERERERQEEEERERQRQEEEERGREGGGEEREQEEERERWERQRREERRRREEAAEREQEEARKQEEEMQRRREEEWGGYEGRRAVEQVWIKA
ncbi:vicilin-like seed storage protein At2g18540 [Rhodamnia argentea]|uniref:Vicilin-like seed storage protein At2g18540 n=1 Tax=Rhodamnia argentea TaxID=178133 RepID=A0A8B8P6V1_9MYRT|nr:vicilin-like seed storage protein At2g18540 [Rhodamnia argentea]